MNRKNVFFIAFLVALLTVSVLYAGGRREAPDPADDVLTIGAAMVDITNPFFVQVMEGGDQVADALGANFIWRSSEGSLETQLAVIESFIEQGVDAIWIDPLDPEAVKPAIRRALAAGIPTVTAANLVEEPGNVSTPFPAYDAFYQLGNMVAAYLNYEGNVLYMSGIPGNWILDQYGAGLEDALAQYPGINVPSVQPARMDPALAHQIMESWLATYGPGEIDAVVFTTDPDMYAALEAIKDAGREGEFPLFSQNGDLPAVEMIARNENEVKIDLLSHGARIGAFNGVVAIHLAQGKELPDVLWFQYAPIMTQDTWNRITSNGYSLDVQQNDPFSVDWMSPEEARAIIADAAVEFVGWTPPTE